MSEHAKLSPSGAKKWKTCPGSLAMEQGEPNDSSEYADEGTAAHALASMCLTSGEHPSAYLGRVLVVMNGVYVPDYTATPEPSNGIVVRQFTVDIDMVAHVNTYIQRIRQLAAGNTLFVEQRVPVGHITGEEGAEGTSDATILTTDDELQVHDLKYGQGVQVFAAENPQGMLYGLGALEKFCALVGDPKTFRFVIHQPRLNHVDEWTCTIDELRAFGEELKARAGDATTALKFFDNWRNDKAPAYLVPGEHCKNNFCKARARCPALANFVQEAVGADFEAIPALSAKEAVTLVPTDLHELGRKNAAVDFILDWCKQIRAKVEAALREHLNSSEAQTALGFKLVQGKRGNRSWTDADAVEALLKKMRLKQEEIYTFNLKTPSALEKKLKDTPKRWAKVASLIEQKEGQPSVAPLDDKRPALVLTPTGNDFEVADGSDLV